LTAWAAAQARVRAAQVAAITQLRHELGTAQDAQLQAVAGLPTPPQALALMDQLEARLWSQSA